MEIVFYLSTCSTCTRILKELSIPKHFVLQDIKSNPIQGEQLDHMKRLSGSYESLFSRRAMKYKSMGLKDKTLTEEDYRKLILEEYTFLKRPVFVIAEKIFIGNIKKTVDEVKLALGK